MAKILGKFIADGAVDSSKVKLENNGYLKGRNAADNGDIDIIKVDGSDALILGSVPKVGATDVALVTDIPTIPSIFERKGNWNGTTNSPALDDTDTSVDGFLYYVNVAGTQDFGAGNITFSIGDWVYNANGAWVKADNNDDVLSVNGNVGVVVLTTDNIAEGTPKYVTAAQKVLIDSATQPSDNISTLTNDSAFVDAAGAKTAAVLNTLAGSETDQAPSVAAVNSAISGAGSTAKVEKFTLDGTDITNGYVDLAQTPLAGTMMVFPIGGPIQDEVIDYTISTNRVTFAGDLAALLVATDKLVISYEY